MISTAAIADGTGIDSGEDASAVQLAYSRTNKQTAFLADMLEEHPPRRPVSRLSPHLADTVTELQ